MATLVAKAERAEAGRAKGQDRAFALPWRAMVFKLMAYKDEYEVAASIPNGYFQ